MVTLELDGAGLNNVRLAFESAAAYAIATRRTLVLPPRKQISQLSASNRPTHLRELLRLKSSGVLPIMTMRRYLKALKYDDGYKSDKREAALQQVLDG